MRKRDLRRIVRNEGTISKREERTGRPGMNRAACLRIVPVLGAISYRDTECSIWSCQTITACKIGRGV